MRLDQAVKNERAKVKDWGFSTSKNKGTPFFWVEFILPEFIAEDGSDEVTIRKDWYITDNTIEYFLRDMAILGWYGKDLTELDKSNQGSHSFYEVEVLISTELEKWTTDQGEEKTIAKATWINDPSFKPMKEMETPEIKTLAAKIKGKIAAYRVKNPVKSNGKKSVGVF